MFKNFFRAQKPKVIVKSNVPNKKTIKKISREYLEAQQEIGDGKHLLSISDEEVIQILNYEKEETYRNISNSNFRTSRKILKSFLPKEESIKCSHCNRRNKKHKLCQCKEIKIFLFNYGINDIDAKYNNNKGQREQAGNKKAKKIVLSKESLKTLEKIKLRLNNIKMFYPNVYECEDNILDQWGRNGSLIDMNQKLLNTEVFSIEALI
ncbi:unnamed protein product [Ceutorhynchus assimilis]|uniref:Uncharacterized protein n=1 Tax=Ceutorhynchus assimilis TaxID=467358 RepID=A0A9N9QLM3_9CUCU|nr:unnamed protein product [Ceutorhynchus assimilis]